MTLLKPTLALRRLVVYKDDRSVFDGAFHNGVNIVRGQNSSGKTTILDFIAYTLGAENIAWKQEALLCDYAVVEVALNGKLVTLRRDVNDATMNPLWIFWGSFDAALRAPLSDWEVFGFRRSTTKLSFTQSILLALDMPEVQGDGASNLTMHQFLRVLYADQPSLHSPIFRTDTFDSALTRETVGAYLAGVHDDQLYSAQLQKRELEKTIQQLDAQIRSIFTVLAKSGQNANFEYLGQELINLETQRDVQSAELSRLRRERTVSTDNRRVNPNNSLRADLDAAKLELAGAQESLARKELEVADSRRFIAEVDVRLSTLDESKATRNYFGNLTFAFCPCCLSEVKATAENNDQCSLCKSPLAPSTADAQVLRMRNELRIQRTESQNLAAEKDAEIQQLRLRVPPLRQRLRTLERTYVETSGSWSSELEATIETISRQLGVLDQEIKGLSERQQLADAIRDLQGRRGDFAAALTAADATIESLIFSQEERKKHVQLEVAETLVRLLKLDLPRQEEFQKAESVQFNFTDNKVWVNGTTQFSESSTVVLRHLFHLAMLSASTRLPDMRFPRFLMLDGIEDGGMELERSHHLQEIIVNECSSFNCEFQLIFATSQIAKTLDNDKFVVARSFSEQSRSLQIK